MKERNIPTPPRRGVSSVWIFRAFFSSYHSKRWESFITAGISKRFKKKAPVAAKAMVAIIPYSFVDRIARYAAITAWVTSVAARCFSGLPTNLSG
jgi:hypothetical protein